MRAGRIVAALLWAGGFVAGAAETADEKAHWKVVVSSVQEDVYPARHLMDGDFQTRWSSPASDPQHVEIDLGRIETVTGLTLHWETAYSSEYSVSVSADGEEWRVVYAESAGDGQTDYVLFPSVRARYIRLWLTKRATGWGHSLWEIDVCRGENRCRILEPEGADVAALIDNDPETAVFLEPPSSLVVDLGEPKALSGVRIDWGACMPRKEFSIRPPMPRIGRKRSVLKAEPVLLTNCWANRLRRDISSCKSTPGARTGRWRWPGSGCADRGKR